MIRLSEITLLPRISRSLQRDKESALPRKIRKVLIFVCSTVLAPLYLRKRDKLTKRPRNHGQPSIDMVRRIVIGDDFNLDSSNLRIVLATIPQGAFEMRNEVSINFSAMITAQELLKTGNRVRIGHYAMMIDSDCHTSSKRFSTLTAQPITNEDDVSLGGRVTVLKGTTIRKGSVITAGSVVSGIIPPFVVAAGVPGRII